MASRGRPFLAGAIACLVQASEATEGPFGIFWRDSRPSSARQYRPPAVRPHRRAHPAGCVPDRVVQQVHSSLASASASPAPRTPGRLGPHRHPGRGVGAPRPTRTPRPGRWACGAGAARPAGPAQQVLGQPGQPQRVGVHSARGLRPVQAVRVVSGHLELARMLAMGCADSCAVVRDQVPLPLLGLASRESMSFSVTGSSAPRPGRAAPAGHAARRSASPRRRPGAARRSARSRVPVEQPGDQGQQGEQQRRPMARTLASVAGCRWPGLGDRGDDDVMPGRADGHHPQHGRQAQRRPRQRAGLAGPAARPRLAGGSIGTSRSAPGEML